MTQRQMLMVYVMLGRLSHNYPVDSEPHKALIAEMSYVQFRMHASGPDAIPMPAGAEFNSPINVFDSEFPE